jgi:enoyl-CoA hydratase
MTFNTLNFEPCADGVGLLKINRPKAMNALNEELFSEFKSFLSKISEDNNLRCLIITGEGDKSFVAGADIKEMQDMSPEQAKILSNRGQEIFNEIEQLPVPVIACVNGFALGGGMELVLACDFVVSSNKAKYGLPEVSLGLIPGYGGTQRLARSIGIHRAKMMTLTGNIYSAQELYEWGLISKLVSPEELLEETQNIASVIAQRAPVAVAKTKASINAMRDLSITDGLEMEQDYFSSLFSTQDFITGVNAFIEKKKPVFSGN